ncbi:MAG: cytochrome c3 family protein, partial [Chloroflexota bacterium]|nr:cytochrome c3 family protein [Chloroflexota bacterium]
MALAAVVVVAIILYPSAAKASPEPPKIPHRIAGQEKCLACHGAQGMKPVPSNHSTFGEGSCLGCHTAAAAPSQESACLSCHNRADLSMTLANGEQLSLHVDPEVFAASIHGNKLLCTDCHSSISSYPHPKREIPSRREYNVAQYELCKRCHFANYTKTFDSVHFEMLSKGDPQAPLCTDCHGAHNVSLPSQPRAKISQTCSRCHDAVYKRYAGSVHGRALIEENNLDVPVCTDCHRSHNIEDPRTAAFRLES